MPPSAGPGGVASLTCVGGGAPAYGTAKVALNTLPRMSAAEPRGDGVLVNAGRAATRAVPSPKALPTVVWAATLPDEGPTGGFFRDGRPSPGERPVKDKK